MNKVFLIGNVTKDLELMQTTSGKSVCKFNIAVNRSYTQGGEKVTDFFTIVTWGGQAETCARYLKKGKKIAVCGELQQRSFEGNDGVKRTVIEVQAQEVEFLSSAERQADSDDMPPRASNNNGLVGTDEPLPF